MTPLLQAGLVAQVPRVFILGNSLSLSRCTVPFRNAAVTSLECDRLRDPELEGLAVLQCGSASSLEAPVANWTPPTLRLEPDPQDWTPGFPSEGCRAGPGPGVPEAPTALDEKGGSSPSSAL